MTEILGWIICIPLLLIMLRVIMRLPHRISKLLEKEHDFFQGEKKKWKRK